MRKSENKHNASEFGVKFRETRQAKNITLNEIAKKTGFTASFISQFERGLTTASVSSMQKIAQVLNTPLVSLLQHEESHIVHNNEVSILKKEDREKINYPAPALTEDFFLTKPDGKLQVIYSTIEPGGNSGDLYKHESDEECVLVLSGIMEVTVGDEVFTLHEGDTITFSSRTLHGWKNIGESKLETLWIMTPPSF